MKFFLLLVIIPSLVLGQNKIVLKGSYRFGKDGDTVFLFQKTPNLDLEKQARWTTILNNGNFKFEIDNQKPSLYRFRTIRTPSLNLFLVPGETTLEIKDSVLNDVIIDNKESLAYHNLYRNDSIYMSLLGKESRELYSLYLYEKQDKIDSAMLHQKEQNYSNAKQSLESYSMKRTIDWIQKNTKSKVNAILLYDQLNFMPEDSVKKLYALIPDTVLNSIHGFWLKHSVNHLFTGSEALEIIQKNPKNEIIKLSNFRGKFVLIDFWASWCLPCRKENPRLVEVYQKYKKSNFIIFGVSLDRSFENWKNAIKQDKLDWIQVSDLKDWNNKAVIDYMIKSIPSNVLIDPNGKILERNIPINKLEEKLNYYIGEK